MARSKTFIALAQMLIFIFATISAFIYTYRYRHFMCIYICFLDWKYINKKKNKRGKHIRWINLRLFLANIEIQRCRYAAANAVQWIYLGIYTHAAVAAASKTQQRLFHKFLCICAQSPILHCITCAMFQKSYEKWYSLSELFLWTAIFHFFFALSL